MTLGEALLFAVFGASFILFGRSDRGQGRLLSLLWQAWGLGLIGSALIGVLIGPGGADTLVLPWLWAAFGAIVVITVDVGKSLVKVARRNR